MLLAGALSLAGEVRVLFVAAARGRAPAAEVLAARRDHATGGSAGPAVHAAHTLASSFPDGQFFLPLHAHTPGQRQAGPADALASLLLTAGVAEQQIPPGIEARASRWRDYVAGKKILLLLDDAAGHEQVRALLPGTAGSLVLVTSRRRLIALEDAAVISLGTLSPDEAALLLARLAGQADLRSGPGPARQITQLCGYLPLRFGWINRRQKQREAPHVPAHRSTHRTDPRPLRRSNVAREHGRPELVQQGETSRMSEGLEDFLQDRAAG